MNIIIITSIIAIITIKIELLIIIILPCNDEVIVTNTFLSVYIAQLILSFAKK